MTSISAPSTPSIFRNSHKDIDNKIIHLLGSAALVSLSGVNKAAWHTLLNDDFFKKRFFSEHPNLVSCPLIFLRVSEIYPNSEWKMASSTMKNENFRPSLFSIKEQASSIDESMESRIDLLKTYLAEICGSHYADPKSPIHQTWEVWQDSERASAKIFSRKEQLKEEHRSTYTEYEWHCVLCLLYSDPTIVEVVRENNEEITSNSFDDRIQQQRVTIQFYKNLLPVYEEIVQLDIARYNNRNEIKKKEQKYLDMEKQREKIDGHLKEAEAQQEKIKHWLSLSPLEQKDSHEDLFSKIIEKLHEQFVIARRVEEENASLSNLIECSNLLKQSPRAQADLDRLHRLINSCPKGIMTKIWESLYIGCANGASEDQWAEKRFHQFLFPLQKIIKSMKKSFRRQQKNYQFVITKQVEEENASLPNLKECSTLLQGLLVQSPRSQADLNRLRELINSCPKRIMTKIWESLYFGCANGASEDQWSEKHFPDFLLPLQAIIEPMKRNIMRQQKYSQ